MVTVVAGPLLNITAIIRKKGIRIRRPKDSTGEGSIISVTASHLSCRSTNKGEELSGESWIELGSNILYCLIIITTIILVFRY